MTMKKCLFAILCMALAGISSCSTNKGTATTDEKDNPYLVGAYADFRSITDEEMQLFESAYTHQAKLIPQSVATQVVAGTNYQFICTDESDNAVKVVIFKPLPNQGEPKVSSIEPLSAYDEIVTSIKEGFEDEWQTKSPEDLGVSPIYQYRHPSMGFAKTDLNGDGILELLLGDSMDAYYDLFTYDAEEGKVNHVFCGGERDRIKFNGSGTIIREGSSSASDSFTKYYRLEHNELMELQEQEAEDDLQTISLEPFKN